MTLITHTTGSGRRNEGGFMEPVFRPFSEMAARIRRYREYVAAEAQLRQLSDHELADIGLSRESIHERVWADFPRG
jgi:uncharacterized protein YjiS (DUF1127 family)